MYTIKMLNSRTSSVASTIEAAREYAKRLKKFWPENGVEISKDGTVVEKY